MAKKKEATLIKGTIKNRKMVILLMFALVFFFLSSIIYFPIPLESKAWDILVFGAGILFGSVKDIISYFFPSQQDIDE